ncbi:polysaccharide deacetylase family protein [Halalkalibacter alkalisediminis]|uniref:Polysaccharide deacetylase family protein n=1 Tax=Halalkalibacter alkalisediminis TaxID=935616 RepID=A0ABV6N9P9_9BACI|nr:polysaccharide deacetylase family protein [Halalkalibacter alkalisediminis]
MKKLIIISSISLTLIIVLCYALNEISSSRTFQFFGGLVEKVKTEAPIVALTFDDGPGVHTEDILNILREEEVQGTFFLTGKEIEAYQEDAIKIVEAGHEVGNHSYSHPRMILRSPTFIKKEIEKTDEWIRQIGYEGEILFRPPYGRKFLFLPYYLHQQDRETILWNLEPETYPEIAVDSQKIIDYVVTNIEPGSIILLHVMYESRRESLQAVRGIIVSLKEQGYTFTTVSELLKYDNQ